MNEVELLKKVIADQQRRMEIAEEALRVLEDAPTTEHFRFAVTPENKLLILQGLVALRGGK